MTYLFFLIDIARALSSDATTVFIAEDNLKSAAIPRYAIADKPARIVITTMTTINSTSVNAKW
jgi:hypothetical protein